MKLNSIDLTITQSDLEKFVYPPLAGKLPVQNLKISFEAGMVVISGTVQNIVTLPFKMFALINVSGAVVTMTLQRIEALGGAGQLFESKILSMLENQSSRFGVIRQNKSFSIDVNQFLHQYDIDSDIVFTRLALELDEAHVGINGMLQLDKVLAWIM